MVLIRVPTRTTGGAGGAGLTFAKVVKSADETVNNSSVLQDDDELTVSLNANKTYCLLIVMWFKTTTTPDFKYGASTPAGATVEIKDNGSSAYSSDVQIGVESLALGQNVPSSNPDGMTFVWGRVVTAGTAGALTFQWAQNIADASDTIVRAGSLMLVWEN